MNPAASTPPSPGAMPYVGLKPYTEDERDRFFGRERDAELLINKIFSHPLTLLYAPSGVGKTSLLRALVIPDLEHKQDAQVVYFDQWNDPNPVERLAATVDDRGAPGGGPNRLVLASQARLARVDKTLVLILDQFEEYLQRYATDLGDLPAALGALVRNNADLRVVIAFREEFLASVDACLREHVLSLFASTYHLEHMDRDRAQDAIRRPALAFGGECEDAFTERLLDDLVPTGEEEKINTRLHRGGIELPFLQLVCRRLWERSIPSGRPALRLNDYNTLGGRQGIVRDYLQQVTRPMQLRRRLESAWILRALAPRSGMKVAFPVESLARRYLLPQRRVQGVLGELERHRIVRPRDAAGGVSYELQHDAFIEIVRPWADGVFTTLKWWGVGLTALFVLGGVARLWWHLDQATKQQDALVTAERIRRSIPDNSRHALEQAIKIAQGSEDPNVQATLRAAMSAFLYNSALPSAAASPNAAKISKDGRWVVVGMDDGIRIINAGTLKSHLLPTQASPVKSIALSGDGSRIAVAGGNGILQVLTRDGKELAKLGANGQPGWFLVDLSADGRQFVAIQNKLAGDARQIPVVALVAPNSTPQPLDRLDADAWWAGFDDAGGLILVWGASSTALLWDVANQSAKLLAQQEGEKIFDARFADHGTGVLVNTDKGPYWWAGDYSTRKKLPISTTALGARVSADGRWLAALGNDRRLELWDLRSSQDHLDHVPLERLSRAPLNVTTFEFSHDSQRLLADSDDTLLAWNVLQFLPALEARKQRQDVPVIADEIPGPKASVHSAWFAGAGNQVVIVGNDGAIQRWRPRPVDLLAVARGGVISSRDGEWRFFREKGILQKKVQTGTGAIDLKLDTGQVGAFSNDGKRLAVGTSNGRLRIWLTAAITPGAPPELDEPLGKTQVVALSFDERGLRLASGGSDGFIRLYEVREGMMRRRKDGEIHAHSGPILNIDLAPDGERLLSTGADGKSQVWSWDGTLLSMLEDESERVQDALFSADGKRILKRSGGRLTIFDCEVWCQPGSDLVERARKMLDGE